MSSAKEGEKNDENVTMLKPGSVPFFQNMYGEAKANDNKDDALKNLNAVLNSSDFDMQCDEGYRLQEKAIYECATAILTANYQISISALKN